MHAGGDSLFMVPLSTEVGQSFARVRRCEEEEEEARPTCTNTGLLSETCSGGCGWATRTCWPTYTAVHFSPGLALLSTCVFPTMLRPFANIRSP